MSRIKCCQPVREEPNAPYTSEPCSGSLDFSIKRLCRRISKPFLKILMIVSLWFSKVSITCMVVFVCACAFSQIAILAKYPETVVIYCCEFITVRKTKNENQDSRFTSKRACSLSNKPKSAIRPIWVKYTKVNMVVSIEPPFG